MSHIADVLIDAGLPVTPPRMSTWACLVPRSRSAHALRVGQKVCFGCQRMRPLDDYHHWDNPHAVAYRQTRCRDCRKRQRDERKVAA